MSAGRAKAGAIGQPYSRVDGVLKVKGKATFTAEYKVENPAYAAMVLSSVARGTIKEIDTSEAETKPGVIAILTHKNAPSMRKTDVFGAGGAEPGAASSSI